MNAKRLITYLLFVALALPCLAFKVKRSGAIDLLAEDKRFFYQHELFIYATPSYTWIPYSDTRNQQSYGGFDIGAGIDYRFFFHQNIGVSLGLQYMPYSSSYQFDAFEQTSSGIDNSDPLYPNNPYTYIERYNVTEVAKLHYLEVPIKALFITPSWNRVQLRTGIGLNLGCNIASNQSLSGYYDAEMIYTDNNVTLNESESLLLGRYNDIEINSPQTILGVHISLLAEIGIGVKLSERCQLNLDLYASYALNNTHTTYKDFIAMNRNYQGILTTNLVGDAHPLAVGGKVGLSFYLGKPKAEILPPWKKRKLRGFMDDLDAYSKNTFAVAEEPNIPQKPTPVQEPAVTPETTIVQEPATKVEPTIEPAPIAKVEATIKPAPIAKAEPTVEPVLVPKAESIPAPKAAVIQDSPNQATPKVVKAPIAAAEPSSQQKALNAPLAFYENSIELIPNSKRILGHIIASLQANPPKQIIVIGHTCNKGTEDSNLDLGILRAEKVRYLLQQSLPYINIQTETQGEAHPLLPNTNEHNRQENRRVEMLYIY